MEGVFDTSVNHMKRACPFFLFSYCTLYLLYLQSNILVKNYDRTMDRLAVSHGTFRDYLVIWREI